MRGKRTAKYSIYTAGLLLAALLLNACVSVTEQKKEALSSSLQPDPKYTPAEVVRIQMEAFQFNDDDDRGIEVAFRFASPVNRRSTGPLTRFARILKTTEYSPILNHISVEYDDVQIRGRRARQRVTLLGMDNVRSTYVFILSYQLNESCGGCWMTDAVIVEQRRQLISPNII